jgi:hypothetical protein
VNKTAKQERKAELSLLPQAHNCHDCGRNRPNCQEVVRMVNGVDKPVMVCGACLRHANVSSRKAPRVTKLERIRQQRAAANGVQ